MCLIIHNPKAKEIHYDILDNALYLNPDGFGIFYHDTGEIQHTMSSAKVDDLLDTKRPYTAHFRYATSGLIGAKQCHPFEIDGTYSLMMNGTIERLVSRKSVDTVELCKILNGLSEAKMLDVLRTYACRFTLLNRKTGDVALVNKDLWHKRDGVLYSKANCFPVPTKSPTSKWFGPAVGNANVKSTRIDDEDPETWGDGQWDEWICQQGTASGCLNLSVEDEEDERIEDEFPNPNQLHTVAVYGTLKAGRGNHSLLADSYALGEGATTEKYPLIQSGIPYLVSDTGVGHHVTVEVYRVTRDTLSRLDGLEGHPNWYVRRKLNVRLDKGGTVTAWVYVIPKEECAILTGMDYKTEPLLNCF